MGLGAGSGRGPGVTLGAQLDPTEAGSSSNKPPELPISHLGQDLEISSCRSATSITSEHGGNEDEVRVDLAMGIPEAVGRGESPQAR